MRKTVDIVVFACMFMVIYHNWTDFPKSAYAVSGPLIKSEIKE